jgi:uncharacterized membrane protein YjgN (DUF898 family)
VEACVDRPYATFTATENKFLVDNAIQMLQPWASCRQDQYDLNTTQIALTGSYHKLLDKKTKQYIGFTRPLSQNHSIMKI